MELLVSALKPDDAAYNLYVGMVTFQPGSGRGISELHSIQLSTGCFRAIKMVALRARVAS